MINIASDFSRYPSGRYISDGPNSGQKFREKFLLPAIEKCESITIVLDGVRGYPSSFTEEAFGGLIRLGIKKGYLKSILKFKYSSDAYKSYEEDIWDAIDKG